MLNTINDLTRIVLNKSRHLDGEWVNKLSKIDNGVLLGISDSSPTTVNETKGTILDTNNPFWEDYVRDINNIDDINDELNVATDMLVDEGLIQVIDDKEDGPGCYIQIRDNKTENTNTLPKEVEFESSESGGSILMKVETDTGVYCTTLQRQ